MQEEANFFYKEYERPLTKTRNGLSNFPQSSLSSLPLILLAHAIGFSRIGVPVNPVNQTPCRKGAFSTFRHGRLGV